MLEDWPNNAITEAPTLLDHSGLQFTSVGEWPGRLSSPEGAQKSEPRATPWDLAAMPAIDKPQPPT